MRYSDLILNPNGRTQAPYGPSELEIFSTVAVRAAFETIQKWPGYKATPLHGLKGLAEQVGLGAIYYKGLY